MGPVAAALEELVQGFSGLVVTTGGTGVTARDLTPEGTLQVVERSAPGLAEAMRLVNPLGRLSRAVAGTVGTAIIIITPGSKEAMLLMHVVFNGEIILPAPSWVSYEPQAKIAENKVHWLQTSRDNNWFPRAEDIEKKIKSIGNKNVILIINSPNNPSGTVCKNLKEIGLIAKKYKIKILSDEIYTDLTFDQNYLSISKFYPEGTFISGGLSKWCGAGGWRLGFFASPSGNKEFISALKTLASESYSTVNSPVQYLSLIHI